ncbi:helix-turn-helix domain-containing protein [Sabulicella rubraurantiaca]|uniref:helix-turn-helix domain-containing protein n=1 Tax=Sabulicella rubraurantiaca TaxID=2811429 RepID=UPI001A9751A2|nr:helix-turn-helix transcriptional regulator [Sabulicella rubraurantiaca]
MPMTGAELKATLGRIGLTQAEFSRLVGCQPPTMSRYVHGALPVPPILAALAAVLDRVHEAGGDAAALLRAARQPLPDLSVA